MRVAVAGGTGTVGRHLVAALAAAGHEPVVLARSTGVDLTTGRGLAAALAGSEVVVDVSNLATTRRARSLAFFGAVTRQLLAAGARAGARHHVALSVGAVDRVDFGYYAGKRAQEALVLGALVPGTVLRAAQFHEFVAQALGAAPGPVAAVPRMQVQPVAAVEVAAALAALAAGPPQGLLPELAGPEAHDLTDLARRLARAVGRRVVVGVRLPGGAGRAMASGALLPLGPGPRGAITFDQWLAMRSGGG